MTSDDPVRTGPDAPPAKRSGGGLDSKSVAAGLVAMLIIVFAATNTQKVKVNFVVASTQASLIVVIAISVVLGVLLSATVARRKRRRTRARD
ncbi:MAG: hypothetical protein JWO74_4803 [Solirubrobacterales bacterium]|nr:hypothetical protein [Solirubrobacterales bacterium]